MFFAPALRTARVSPAFLPRSLDQGFERFVNDALSASRRGAARVTQDDTSWTLSLDVPGLSREHLHIGIEGAVMRIESKADAPRQV